MTNARSIRATLVDIGGAALELTMAERTRPVMMAAHPTDAFDASTLALLEEASGVGVACVNPRGISSTENQTIEEIVDDLENVRRAAGLGRIVFWGMSGGGWLGLAYARRYPEALDGLVLESVCASFRARVHDPACLLSPFHPAWQQVWRREALSAVEGSERALADATWAVVDGAGLVLRNGRGEVMLVSPAPLSERMRTMMPAFFAFDARPWLPRLRTPTLIVCGSADPIVPVSHVRGLADGIGGTLVEVPGAGHVPTVEGRPEARVAIREYLARLGTEVRS